MSKAAAHPHLTPSPAEEAHIRQAIDASQTAIDAIGTIVSVSTWALAIIALAIAVIAWWGWATLKAAAKEEAERIANKRFDSYMISKQFLDMIAQKIEAIIEKKLQDEVLGKLQESSRAPEDPVPFPKG